MKFLVIAAAIFTISNVSADLRFEAVGDMTAKASQHRDLLLKNGNVLLTGGQSGEGGISDAQIFNPKSRTFSAAGDMTEARFVHAMNLLPNGDVLITGGFSKAGQFLKSTELYDGKTFKKGENLLENRDNQRTINLPDNRVFIEGGDNERYGYISSTEIFDSKKKSFSAGPILPTGRSMDTINSLPGGKVILAGGLKIEDYKQVFLKETIIYDAKTNSVTKGPSLNEARKQHRATSLRDGRVFFTGGINETGTLKSTEIYARGNIKKTANMSESRREHCSIELNDGRIIIMGGHNGAAFTNTTEIYEPSKNRFIAGPSLLTERAFHTCTLLNDGRVLVSGGYNNNGALKSAELLSY